MHVLERDRAYLHAHADEEVPPEALHLYSHMIAERTTGKPTQYITGHQEFWGLDFEVTADVLIPRPETEHIVECVLEMTRRQGRAKDSCLHVVDVGPEQDVSRWPWRPNFPARFCSAWIFRVPPLVVASRNAVRLGMPERVKFLESDLLERLLEPDFAGTFDFVLSNPPYVGKHEADKVQREVREFEPRLAWGGDLERGEEIYARLFPQAFRSAEAWRAAWWWKSVTTCATACWHCWVRDGTKSR